MPDGCVTSRFKILVYYRVRSVFKPARALPSNMICNFENSFGSFHSFTISFIFTIWAPPLIVCGI
jgi:hypothetical protein